MKKQPFRRALCLGLTLCLLAGLAPVSAQAVTQDEIDALQQQKEQLQAQRDEKQAVLDGLEAEHAEADERKQAMDERNLLVLEQLQLNSEQIQLYADMIEDEARKVEDAEALEQAQLERYRARARAMEENGNLGFLALVLGTSDLGELLTRLDDVGDIMHSDRELWDKYIAARENTEQTLAEYEAVKADIEAKQAELRGEQGQLESELAEVNQLIYELAGQIEGQAEELAALDESVNQAQREIDEAVAELERQKAEEEAARRAAEAAEAEASGSGSSGGGSGGGSGGIVYSTGSFIWPVPSCTYITSRFGPRYHPVTGLYQSTHTGLDIGASYGAAIQAADSGEVFVAGVKGGYGNCVMIDHGNGYYTLYGHMSSIAVSVGQVVSQGDTVGYVGSTGVSTGPHCHFEIRVDGDPTDPAPWFSGLSYAPDA